MSLRFSVEFFPPQSEFFENVSRVMESYVKDFPIEKVSITHGATGGNKDKSLLFIEKILDKRIIEPKNIIAHLSCAGLEKDEVLGYAQKFYDFGIREILVIKGDVNGAFSVNGYENSSQAMHDIKKMLPHVVILGACFPEERNNVNEVQVLKDKVSAGAENFISQFCFENNLLKLFYDTLQKNDIKSNVMVGVVIPTVQTLNFAKKCNAHISEELVHIAKDDKTAMDFVLKQLHTIEEIGYKAVHLYSLNKLDCIAVLKKYLNSK